MRFADSKRADLPSDASFARVIRFDRRGTGASDPLPLDALPPWESFVEELDRVMTEVGSERAAIMTAYDAGRMGMLFAATKPECTVALILVNTSAKYVAEDGYPTSELRRVRRHHLPMTVAASPGGTRVFVAGTSPGSSGDGDFVTVAYAA